MVEFFDIPVLKKDKPLIDESTLALLPKDVAARVKLSLVKQAQGRGDESLDLLKDTVAVHPDNPNLWMALGNVYLHLGFMENAVAVFLQILRIDSDNVSACYRLGKAYLGLNHYQQAIRAFLKATRLDPAHIPSWQELGEIYQQLHRSKNAKKTYRRLLELDQDNAHARAFFAGINTLNSK